MAADLLVLQHTAYAGLGRLAAALPAGGCTADVRRVDLDDELPVDLRDHDGLVVLGGPQSVWSDVGFPTRATELALVRDALSRGVPYLGICLGAQLLAYAAGARCYRGQAPEIGWTPVQLTEDAAQDELFGSLPDTVTVMESHSDHYLLPSGAVRLAAGNRYANQAFRVTDAAWGLQFHLEADEDFAPTRRLLISDWAATERDAGPVSVADELHLRASAPVAAAVFGGFVELVAGAAEAVAA